jgi:hypothetical protein
MTDRVVIFLHLPKAAGSTLNRVIAQQYPPAAIFKIAGPPTPDVMREIAEKTGEGGAIRVITGHAPFGVHAAVTRPFTYLTVLRDPVDRLLSHFYFAGKLPTHPLHAEIASGALTVTELARRLANLQTRYLADKSARKAGEPSSDKTLASAKENLSRYFAVVGIAERFDETQVLLQRRLGWKARAVVNSNVTRGRPSSAVHSEEDRAAIRAVNALDLDLYDWARTRFDTEIAAEGRGFRREVNWLRARNRVFNLRHRLLGANPAK